jgi:hypothetical protein
MLYKTVIYYPNLNTLNKSIIPSNPHTDSVFKDKKRPTTPDKFTVQHSEEKNIINRPLNTNGRKK